MTQSCSHSHQLWSFLPAVFWTAFLLASVEQAWCWLPLNSKSDWEGALPAFEVILAYKISLKRAKLTLLWIFHFREERQLSMYQLVINYQHFQGKCEIGYLSKTLVKSFASAIPMTSAHFRQWCRHFCTWWPTRLKSWCVTPLVTEQPCVPECWNTCLWRKKSAKIIEW